MASSVRVVLVTGASRGIGYGLVQHYAKQPSTLVIGSVRTTDQAQKVVHLPVAKDSRLLVSIFDVTDQAGTKAAAQDLITTHHIAHIDIVIANAGTCEAYGAMASVDIDDFRRDLEVNTIGLLNTFQAFWPLLQRSTLPKFIGLSTRASSNGEIARYADPPKIGAYGATKSAVNYLLARIAFEYPSLTAVALCPGWVQTEMGNKSARSVHLDKAPISVDDSVEALCRSIANFTRADSGRFVWYNGSTVPW